MSADVYTQGWADADKAIQHRFAGYLDYSQGDTEWDRGWNARIDQSRGSHDGIRTSEDYRDINGNTVGRVEVKND